MSTVIKVENLGKKYTLRHQQRESYTALRDVIASGAKNLARRFYSPFVANSAPLSDTQEEFWALKDVSFEVKQGDRVGIIGRNGAGKSTLLKILSRITEPTEGRIGIKGRVASLLEVGTGFHPELTGRENIYLNGAILGMSRADIKLKFDEIVAFAEVEKFLDTPVKRYSSGMYVRLAFAVAAHLEPEILIVDEVLAVGDAQFQEKCLGKMGEVSKDGGRAILFVSHNMPALRTLCSKCIWLDAGKVKIVGDLNNVADNYLSALTDFSKNINNANGTRFVKVFLVDSLNRVRSVFSQHDEVCLVVQICVEKSRDMNCGVTIFNSDQIPLISTCLGDSFPSIKVGVHSYKVKIPLEILFSGTYRIEGAIWDDMKRYDQDECLTKFSVVRNDSTLEMREIGSRAPLRFPNSWRIWNSND